MSHILNGKIKVKDIIEINLVNPLAIFDIDNYSLRLTYEKLLGDFNDNLCIYYLTLYKSDGYKVSVENETNPNKVVKIYNEYIDNLSDYFNNLPDIELEKIN